MAYPKSQYEYERLRYEEQMRRAMEQMQMQYLNQLYQPQEAMKKEPEILVPKKAAYLNPKLLLLKGRP